MDSLAAVLKTRGVNDTEMEPDALGSGTVFSRKSFFFSKGGDYIVRTTNWSKVTKEYHSNKYMCMVCKQQISEKRKQEIMRFIFYQSP